jgi:hypothetical protein
MTGDLDPGSQKQQRGMTIGMTEDAATVRMKTAGATGAGAGRSTAAAAGATRAVIETAAGARPVDSMSEAGTAAPTGADEAHVLGVNNGGVFVTREHVRHNKSGIAHRGRARINH